MNEETRQFVNKRSVQVLLAALLLLLSFSVFVGDGATSDDRASCERGNLARSSELGQRNDLVQNATERAEDPATAEEGKAALRRALHRRQQLIDSVAPVASEPGSVIVDCEEAYPRPVPLNWLD